MFKYSRDGVSVLTILDTRRAKKEWTISCEGSSSIQEKTKILLNRKGTVERRLGKVA